MTKKHLFHHLFLLPLFLSYAISSVAQGLERIYTLEQLFVLADSCSHKLKTAQISEEVASANLSVKRNAQLPDITFSASASLSANAWMTERDFSNSQWLPSPRFGNNFALEVKQIIYVGGAIKHSLNIAELQVDLAHLDFENQQKSIRFLIAGYYLNLYKFRNMLMVFDHNIERTQQVIDNMKARESEGIAINNDITRYEVQMQNLLYRRVEIQNQIDVLNNQLVVSLGLPQGTQIIPDFTMLSTLPTIYSEAELQELAQKNSPRLKMSEKGIDISRQSKKLAYSGMIPKISAIAADNLRGPITTMVPPVNKNINAWYIGLGLSFEIGNLYKSQREVNLSNLHIRQAQSRYNEVQEALSLEVYQAYTNYKNALELLFTQEKSLQLANENYAVVENRYNNDLVLLIDLLDADNIRLDAEIQYENARINIIYNYYKLLYTIGTL